MLALEEAQKQIVSDLQPLEPVASSLVNAAGRILAESIVSQLNLPPFDNSAMDGYAVQAKDVSSATETNPAALQLIGKVAAGAVFDGEVSSGYCVRLFTGSPLPRGADAVVMQEDTQSEASKPETIWIRDGVKPWENVRFKGEDVKQGTVTAKAGDRLSFGKISLLAATGCSEVKVFRAPVVGVVATGSELQELGQPLNPGQIYESNRAALSVVVSLAGATAKRYPLVQDTLAATETILKKALRECDVVITSGGVSVGEFDYVKSAFQQLGGDLSFWRVALRPGKPFVFGKWKGKSLFGLPGNPVSALVTFLLLVRPALLKLQGSTDLYLRKQTGLLTGDLVNRGDRRHFVRVTVHEDGTVHSAGLQGSHALSSLSLANGLVDVPPKSTLKSGEKVSVLKWD